MSTLLLSSDEVAKFLLYVNKLGYQEKPDYQYLKNLWGSAVRGGLDLSKPQGAAGESPTKNPRAKEKVRTQNLWDGVEKIWHHWHLFLYALKSCEPTFSRYLASYWNVGSVRHLSIAAHFLSGCGHFTGTGVFQDDNARIRQADYESMIHHHRLLALTPVGIFVMWWSDYSHHWLALLKMFLVHWRITTMTQKLRIHQKH